MLNETMMMQTRESLAVLNSSHDHNLAIDEQGEINQLAKKKIIIVDNDAGLRAQIKAMLIHESYWVKEAASAAEMDALLIEFEADMVLLDVMLPDEDGLSIIKRLKKQRSVDMVVLSSLCDVDHRIEGLSSGAGYYLSKPVDMRELLAVVRNRFISRKKKDSKQEKKWVLKTKQWQFTTPEGENYSLNNTEFTLISLLAKHARLGRATTKEELYNALDKQYLPQCRSLDLHISRLRQRFSNKNQRFPLKTLRNVGYELTEGITVSFN